MFDLEHCTALNTPETTEHKLDIKVNFTLKVNLTLNTVLNSPETTERERFVCFHFWSELCGQLRCVTSA